MSSHTSSRQALSEPKPAKNGAAERATSRGLRELERLFEARPWPRRGHFLEARRRARVNAKDVIGEGEDPRAAHTALVVAAAELLRSLVEADETPATANGGLADELEEGFGVSRMELAREVLRAPELLLRSPDGACRLLLSMLVALAPLRSASLWSLDGDAPICVCHLGDGRPSRGAQQVARRLLAGEAAASGTRRLLVGLAIGHRAPPTAAVVGCSNPGLQERSLTLLAEAAPMLAALVERNALLAANAESERALLESSERKLTRLGFDLHDGPIQDVAVLGEDLRLFGAQLESVLDPIEHRELVRGRVEDLDAQLSALDGELRRLSGEVQAASVLLNRPFPAALGDRVGAFVARTGIEPEVSVTGDTGELSTSQQIALLNIIQEALSNIREHAVASGVRIKVAVDREGVKAEVVDNGQGFDLESTLMRAAREGRIGLLAMNERVRLLGGQCRIESRPGGPTVVSVALERWLPLQSEAQPRSLSA